VVKDRPLPSIKHSASTMIKANTNAVLLATYQFAQARGLDFHLAGIDPAYPTSSTNDLAATIYSGFSTMASSVPAQGMSCKVAFYLASQHRNLGRTGPQPPKRPLASPGQFGSDDHGWPHTRWGCAERFFLKADGGGLRIGDS
jgi:hypothetical protein